ncbi:45206_t:CDS:2 [Gigaspora margarita]|uniref:45206_t:CDS:1 n=1 Tax=Gigaspora margarita TaxID=4874 RepID=A0ABN7V1K3_GIGMA|nr:45206_t:CDS:2 [Gigaspora margarita]
MINIVNSQYAKEASNYIKILNELRHTISLHKEYGKHKRCLSNPIVTKFGSLINDPVKVKLMARRAQKALLNPITNSNKYINWRFKDEDNSQLNNSLKFTKNAVCIEIKGSNVPNLRLIEIKGSNVPNLSLIDLFGIISKFIPCSHDHNIWYQNLFALALY